MSIHVQSHPFRWTDQQCQPVFVHRFPKTSSCEPMATHLNTPFRDHLNWLRLKPLFALGPGNYLELVGVQCMLGMILISNIGCHLRSGEWIMEILDKRQTLCHPPWYKLIRPRSTTGYSFPIIELWHALLLLSFLFLDNGTVGQITLVCYIVPSAELVRVNWSPMHVPHFAYNSCGNKEKNNTTTNILLTSRCESVAVHNSTIPSAARPPLARHADPFVWWHSALWIAVFYCKWWRLCGRLMHSPHWTPHLK